MARHPSGSAAGVCLNVPEGMGGVERLLLSRPLPHESPPTYTQLLAVWLARLPVELFGGRIIRPLQRYLTGLASQVKAVDWGRGGTWKGEGDPPLPYVLLYKH